MLERAAAWFQGQSTTDLIWVGIGFFAQIMFTMRFLVQWIASEKARRSVVPEMFWYFSLGGGVLLFAYAFYRFDPVFMLGQGMGLVIYARNVYFVWSHKRSQAAGDAVPSKS
ncbi:lipid-A-disaccharide synthase N-terminal domain-containing protein [Azospirillum sp. YIM B02556]|uniref:Lipid-A-disaccharide synthase N-terminal domain-containing protein n=1 Tax=Azospirillum endophyticum TaxID=2800326 RepID=A0ABS1F8A9_9PROT|nr:lipid-A-disaccharide synthase N-terminal domain-containing protein [Azospirillum endophyticum]MBK1839622.1 lipid-A-disaccharide synthase N-terminal domain-containing protein [Azospirillum endophyticum]